MPTNFLAISGPKAEKNRVAFLVAFSSLITMLGLSASEAMAGCNSGNQPQSYLLTNSGCQANASGDEALAIGEFAVAPASYVIAIGDRAGSSFAKLGSIMVGVAAGQNGSGEMSTALGSTAHATGDFSIAIGGGHSDPGFLDFGARAKGRFSIAIGTTASAVGVNSTAIGEFAGDGAGSGNAYNSAFGGQAGRFVTGVGNTGVGLAAGHTVKGDVNTALGNSAGQNVTGSNNLAGGVVAGDTVKGSYNSAFGDSAGNGVSGNNNLALGRNAGRNVKTSSTISIGTSARALGLNAIALGTSAKATATGSVAIGQGSLANVANTVSVGSSSLRRRIVNVAPPVNGTDAVNLAQVQSLLAAQAQEIADLQLALRTLQAQVAGLTSGK